MMFLFKMKSTLQYHLFVDLILLSFLAFEIDSVSTHVHTTEKSRQSLYKRHLLISSTRSPLVEEPKLSVISFGIIEQIVLDILASHLGFTYQIIPPRDILSAGFLQKNGSWTGTTGQLQRKEVDMCITLSAASTRKREILDISYPVIYANSAILVRFPKEKNRIWSETSSFQFEAWIAIIVTFVVTILISWLIYRILSQKLPVKVPTLSYWTFFYFSLWTSQSVILRRSAIPFRIVCLVSLFGIYIIMNYFTASYTSILSTPVFISNIKSVEDLAKSTRVKTLLIKGSSTEEHIMSSSAPTLRKIANQVQRFPERRIVNALTVGDISTIVKDNTALIMVQSNAESLIEDSYNINQKCLVTLAEKTFFGRPQFLTYPKNSPIAKAIDYNLMLMHQAGLIEYAERTAKSRNRCRIPDLKTAKAEQFVALGQTEMNGLFVIAALGMAFSCFIFLAELIVTKMMKALACK